MAEGKKGKVNLSGLSKGSNNFPSFRFSPENEEIEEILLEDPIADSDEKAQSLPDSPKATGDVSPLKEIFKHKWTNKWEKRSLSLDLDLKGKLITAIEDKKKSIRSHFISEEGEVIPTSNSITEHIGMTGENMENDQEYSSSERRDPSDEVYEAEEVGTDYMVHIGYQEQFVNNALKFTIPSEMLEEYHHGSVINRPLNPKDTDRNSEAVNTEDLKPSNVFIKMFTTVYNHDYVSYLTALLTVAIALSVAGYALLSGFLWMIVGGLSVIIWQQSLCTTNTNASKVEPSTPRSNSSSSKNSDLSSSSYENLNFDIDRTFASQGWMTEVDTEYDPITCHIQTTKVIFVRLRGSHLYVSYPHPKSRILKRRLWNDPQLTGQFTFTRHCIYSLVGAKVYIAPERLSKRRIWSKKYPIAIKLNNTSTVTIVSPSAAADPENSSDPNTPVPTPTVGSDTVSLDQGATVVREDSGCRVLYLFTRTDREKDYWFRDLVGAARARDQSPLVGVQSYEDLLSKYLKYMATIIPSLHSGDSSQDSSREPSTANTPKEKSQITEKASVSKKESDTERSDHDGSHDTSRKSSPSLEDSMGMENIVTIPQSPEFLNAFMWRIFFDFLHNSEGTVTISELIQKKLNYIRKPQFLDTLMVRDLDLGTALPVIQRSSVPIVDDRGLWIDLDISYDGNIIVTLETKLNLLKLRKSPSQEHEDGSPSHGPTVNLNSDDHTPAASPITVANMFDSDAYDSGESSEDELSAEELLLQQQNGDANSKDENVPQIEISSMGSKGKKILKMAEKIASSKYVQQATEMKVVKKAIANVSNTPLVLSVELKNIVGTLVLNVPPPPTDRLWLGFRYNPAMQISARPKFGSRTIGLTHVIDWIEKKLLHEFQRVMVFPNMNDVTIPLLDFKLPE